MKAWQLEKIIRIRFPAMKERMTLLSLLFFGMAMICPRFSFTQIMDDLLGTEVTNTFQSPHLINHQTTQVLSQKTFEFRIQHRSGTIAFDKSIYKEFLGLDLMANIRLGIAFPVTKDLMLGAGRTKNGKTLDFEAKYALLKQSTETKTPVSLSLYGNTAVNTDDFPRVPSHYYFSDSTTPFVYKPSHRFSYCTEALVSRLFGSRFSVQAGLIFIWRNLVPDKQVNHTFSIPLTLRYRFGRTAAVVGEYGFNLNNRPPNKLNPFSLGVELGTSGHSFRLFISSSQQVLDQQLYSLPSSDYLRSDFLFGFNITRTFWRKEKMK